MHRKEHWQPHGQLESHCAGQRQYRSRFRLRLLKTGLEPTSGRCGKGQPVTNLKPSSVQRKPIPGSTWSGCAFATRGTLTHGRISLCPMQSVASLEKTPLPKCPIPPIQPMCPLNGLQGQLISSLSCMGFYTRRLEGASLSSRSLRVFIGKSAEERQRIFSDEKERYRERSDRTPGGNSMGS